MNTKCLICGSLKKKQLFIGRDRLHVIPGEFNVVQCTHCSLITLDPLPSLKELSKYYPKEYHAYMQYDPGNIQERFAIFLYKLFFTKSSRNLPLKLVFLPFKHLLRGTRIIPGNKILDVGCGNGSFLYKMQAAGMDAYGVEISSEGCKHAEQLGLKIKCGVLEQQHYPKDYFDIITLNHVLEHVQDPVATLCELRRILKPDGRIIIAVPNSKSLARWIFGRFWASLDVPRHLTIYTPHTIKLAAGTAKLRIKSIRYISFPFQFQASLAYLLYCHQRIPLDQTWVGESKIIYWLLFPLVYLVDFLKMGDVIEITLTRRKTI